MPKTYLVLSGIISRDDDMSDFWIGFINIQNFLTTDDDLVIVGHSWDESKKGFLESVFGDILLSFEKFDYSSGIKGAVLNIEKFIDDKLNRIPSLFYFFQSRHYALNLINSEKLNNEDRVVLTRYDIGYRKVTPEGSTIIIDDTLPRDLIYMPFYHEIDEGYGDQWAVFNKNYIDFFLRLDITINETLSNNDYFVDFTSKWRNSKRRSDLHSFFFYRQRQLYKKLYNFFVSLDINNIYIRRKVQGLVNRLKDYQNIIGFTAENDSLDGFYYSSYPKKSIVNSHALLKYQILKYDLRKSSRFLDYLDFEKKKSGKIINQKPFSVLIFTISHNYKHWEDIIFRFLKFIPNMKYEIYLATEDSSSSRKRVEEYSNIVTPLFYPDNGDVFDNYSFVMDKMSTQSKIVYFVRDFTPLFSFVDEIYLNSLLHYFDNSNEKLIQLNESPGIGKETYEHPFPGLCIRSNVINPYKLTVPFIIKPELFNNIFNIENNFSCYHDKNLLFSIDSSMVKNNKNYKDGYLLNSKFPHEVNH